MLKRKVYTWSEYEIDTEMQIPANSVGYLKDNMCFCVIFCQPPNARQECVDFSFSLGDLMRRCSL